MLVLRVAVGLALACLSGAQGLSSRFSRFFGVDRGDERWHGLTSVDFTNSTVSSSASSTTAFSSGTPSFSSSLMLNGTSTGRFSSTVQVSRRCLETPDAAGLPLTCKK